MGFIWRRGQIVHTAAIVSKSMSDTYTKRNYRRAFLSGSYKTKTEANFQVRILHFERISFGS